MDAARLYRTIIQAFSLSATSTDRVPEVHVGHSIQSQAPSPCLLFGLELMEWSRREKPYFQFQFQWAPHRSVSLVDNNYKLRYAIFARDGRIAGAPNSLDYDILHILYLIVYYDILHIIIYRN